MITTIYKSKSCSRRSWFLTFQWTPGDGCASSLVFAASGRRVQGLSFLSFEDVKGRWGWKIAFTFFKNLELMYLCKCQWGQYIWVQACGFVLHDLLPMRLSIVDRYLEIHLRWKRSEADRRAWDGGGKSKDQQIGLFIEITVFVSQIFSLKRWFQIWFYHVMVW